MHRVWYRVRHRRAVHEAQLNGRVHSRLLPVLFSPVGYLTPMYGWKHGKCSEAERAYYARNRENLSRVELLFASQCKQNSALRFC